MTYKLGRAKYRHAKYYLTKAQQINAKTHDGDIENIHRAIEFCVEQNDLAILTKFIVALGDFWFLYGYLEVFVKYASSPPIINALEAEGKLDLLAKLAMAEEARANYKIALELRRKLINSLEQTAIIKDLYDSVRNASNLAIKLGDNETAADIMRQYLKRVSDSDKSIYTIELLLELSKQELNLGNMPEAERILHNAIGKAEISGYSVAQTKGTIQLAQVKSLQGNDDVAINLLKKALKWAEAKRDAKTQNRIRRELNSMMRTIFISYSHADRKFVEKLASDLQEKFLKVWWDEWEIKVGDSIIEKIGDGIQSSAFLIAVLSETSVESNWVRRELGSALMRQLSGEKNITVLPERIDNCDGPILLQEIKWADFREDYSEGFQELLEVLR